MLIEAIYYFKCDWCGAFEEVCKPSLSTGDPVAHPTSPGGWLRTSISNNVQTGHSNVKRVFCHENCYKNYLAAREKATKNYYKGTKLAGNKWGEDLQKAVDAAQYTKRGNLRKKKVKKC